MRKRFFLVLVGMIWAPSSVVEAANQAGVVIQSSTGQVITRCVEFEETNLSAVELLKRSGFKHVTQSSAGETTLCFLHDDGSADCSPHAQGWKWILFLREGDEWTPLSANLSAVSLVPGALIAFAYGPDGTWPPNRTFADVCGITRRAALVIDHGGGARVTRGVEFPGETLTGLQLLQRSGLEIITHETAFGISICSIGGEGQPAADCFGDPDGRYWGLNILGEDNTWRASELGVSDCVVFDHSVLGFIFATYGTEQPPITREELFEAASHVPGWDAYGRD
ncbi:MAG: hypothetical protein ACE15F_06645 [bacterium]